MSLLTRVFHSVKIVPIPCFHDCLEFGYINSINAKIFDSERLLKRFQSNAVTLNNLGGTHTDSHAVSRFILLCFSYQPIISWFII